MPWIRVISPAATAANSRLARLYRSCVDEEHGEVDNILTIHSLRPDTLAGHLALYRATLHPRRAEGLGRREREVIAIAVSAVNACHY